MANEARIYAVKNTDTGETHMVKATNQPQAMRHVAKSKFAVAVASSLAVVDHMTAGGKVLDATGPQSELPIDQQ